MSHLGVHFTTSLCAFNNISQCRILLCFFQRHNVTCIVSCIFQRHIFAFSNVTMYNNVFMCYVLLFYKYFTIRLILLVGLTQLKLIFNHVKIFFQHRIITNISHCHIVTCLFQQALPLQ